MLVLFCWCTQRMMSVFHPQLCYCYPWLCFTCLSFLKEHLASADAESSVSNCTDLQRLVLCCSEHEMGTKECESLLLDRDRQLHPCNPEGIIAEIVSCKTRAEIGQLLTSGDKIAPLIVEAVQQFPQLPPLQPPNVHHGLLTFPHSHPHPIGRFQGIQTPLHWSHSWPQSHPSCISHEFQAPYLFPHLQPQFRSTGTFYGFHAPFPLPHPQPQFGFSGKSHEFHAPLPLNVQTGPLQLGLPQLHPSLSFHGIHAPFTPIGPTGAFRSPSPEFTGSGELMLEKEIRELLFLLQPPSLPVESLANMYMDRYGKPLRNEGLLIDGQQQGKAGCSLTNLLMRLNTTRVIERFLLILFISASFTLDRCLFLRLHSHYDSVCFNFRQGHQYIVPVEDAHMYLAHGFRLGMPPSSSNSNKIFVVFMPESKFTEEYVHSYFRYCCLTSMLDASWVLTWTAHLLCSYASVNNIIMIFLPVNMVLSMTCEFQLKEGACMLLWASRTPEQQNRSYQKGSLVSSVEIQFLSKSTRKNMN